MKYTFFVYLIICSFILISCSEQRKYERKLGIEFNNTRSKIGLPLLSNEWMVSNRGKDQNGFYFIKWSNSFIDREHYPCLLNKTVAFDSNNILYEENEYVGKDTFATIDGIQNVTLYVTYNFIDKNTSAYSQSKGWECFIENKNSIYNLNSGKITLSTANSILKKWNIKPLGNLDSQ